MLLCFLFSNTFHSFVRLWSIKMSEMFILWACLTKSPAWLVCLSPSPVNEAECTWMSSDVWIPLKRKALVMELQLHSKYWILHDAMEQSLPSQMATQTQTISSIYVARGEWRRMNACSWWGFSVSFRTSQASSANIYWAPSMCKSISENIRITVGPRNLVHSLSRNQNSKLVSSEPDGELSGSMWGGPIGPSPTPHHESVIETTGQGIILGGNFLWGMESKTANGGVF